MPGRLDPRLRRAVDASIGWYEHVFALHGIGSRTEHGVWSAVGAPPALHSDVVTVEPDASAEQVERALAGRGRWGLKDSFASIEPAAGALLFGASWIHRGPAEPLRVSPWHRVSDPGELARWNAGYDTAAVLVPALLDRACIAVLARVVGGEITAGAVARLGSGMVDVSNVHGVDGHPVDWLELAGAIGAHFPERDLVGYERDAELAAAIAADFTAVGELRVWVG